MKKNPKIIAAFLTTALVFTSFSIGSDKAYAEITTTESTNSDESVTTTNEDTDSSSTVNSTEETVAPVEETVTPGEDDRTTSEELQTEIEDPETDAPEETDDPNDSQTDSTLTETAEPEANTSYTPYISFGANLSASEKATVMKLLGVTTSDLSSYKVITVSNDEEYTFLGDYISKEQIGTRALSSVKVIKTEDGTGINVTTHNINYVSSVMYQNALLTAGIEDASVTVAGPFSLSGTAALVGAMKAYSEMTGVDISDSTMDTATEELIVTAELADSIGDKEKAAELIAATKQKVFEDQLSTKKDIENALASCSSALHISISDEDQEKITDLMMKIKDEDVDVNAIKEQAKNIYDKLKDSGIDFKNIDTKELEEKTGNFFSNIFNAIKDFFTGLFG